ncbi:MAG: hypothetical protein A2854_03180 [Parcubacteria group bacterium RIFCSPHIGHO2_01_FULL_56_18]|nr:MAG: hypothetical protein A2854_03180 [Parcubacteria group bacterium RIFCSPHIGHO2_01_FULL_56_18]
MKIELLLTVSLCGGLFAMATLAIPSSSNAQAIDCVNGQVVSDDPAQNGGPCTGTANDGVDPAVTASSPTLSNDGIFGCLGQGARVQNVGTRAAIGGVYVPVNDAAVTLNTGFLVYKECILDGVARKIAESGTAELGRQNLNAIATGRGGSPQFVVDDIEEIGRQSDIIIVDTLTANSRVLCPAFQTNVRSSIARSYMQRRNQPNVRYACSMPTSSNARFWDTLAALRNPQNNPYGAQIIFEDEIAATMAYNEFRQRQRWQINDGFYDTVDDPNNPLGAKILTPGFIIARSLEQMLGSGYRQLENASEIDQVVANLFGGLTTQLVSDTRGLIGLTQPLNGQASYVDRMVAQTSASVRTQASNAALAVIGAAREIEVSYRQAKEGIATALSNAIEKLRAAEKQCWALIIPKVEERAAGQPLQIATTTQASQLVIDANIAPLATTTVRDIRNSDTALATLNQLIASVSNSASQANQQQALLRLDTMVANRQLHTTTDANNAIQQRDAVATALTKLVDDTIKAWGDDNDPNIGWCNVNNPAVIERWFNEWR